MDITNSTHPAYDDYGFKLVEAFSEFVIIESYGVVHGSYLGDFLQAVDIHNVCTFTYERGYYLINVRTSTLLEGFSTLYECKIKGYTEARYLTNFEVSSFANWCNAADQSCL